MKAAIDAPSPLSKVNETRPASRHFKTTQFPFDIAVSYLFAEGFVVELVLFLVHLCNSFTQRIFSISAQ